MEFIHIVHLLCVDDDLDPKFAFDLMKKLRSFTFIEGID
jgi:hypothetical protein